MRINSSDRKLALIIKAMNESIIPELTSTAGLTAAGIINETLTDLLKRESVSPEMLRECITEGIDVLQAMASSIDHQLDLSDLSDIESECFPIQISQHANLTEKLADMCESVVASSLAADTKMALLQRVAEWELSYYQRQATLSPPDLPANAERGRPLSQALLQQYLQETSGDSSIAVTQFNPLAGGFGKQTYMTSYTADSHAEKDLVIRKTDPMPIMNHGACILRNEFELLSALAKVDYPAPKPREFCANYKDIDGSFYSMDRITGSQPGTFLDGAQAGEISAQIYWQLAELLGRLHSLPLETFSDYIAEFEDPVILSGTVADCYRHNLQGWQQYMQDTSHLRSPYLFWLVEWLHSNLPEDYRPPVLVHGDFNIHNILAEDNHVTAILDWECAGFGSPEQDLSYIKPLIPEHVSWDEFVRIYQANGGQEINAEAMQFGAAYATLRTNLAGNRATFNLQAGTNQDVRYTMVEQGYSAFFMNSGLQSANN